MSQNMLQKYIQIKTVHPNPDYNKAIDYLSSIAEKYNLDHRTINLSNYKKALLITYKYDTTKETILFNSHMDVVPVSDNLWNTDPFSGEIIDGKMYGRGTQDMKSVGIQYLLGLINFSKRYNNPNRNILLTYVPDEEISSVDGMNILSEKISSENIIFAFDEGIPNIDNKLILYNSERKMWWIKLTSHGEAGHGSKYIENSAVRKIYNVIGKFIEYAEKQKNKDIDTMITINVNYINIGNSYMYNVIPNIATAGLDIRVPVSTNVDIEGFYNLIEEWCHGIEFEFINGTNKDKFVRGYTKVDECGVLNSVLDKIGQKYEYRTFPATTDARFVRNMGIPTIGMSLLFNTENRLHDHNEYIKVDDLDRGGYIYGCLMEEFAK